MMRNWRLRRAARACEQGGLIKSLSLQQQQQRPPKLPIYQPDELRAVTLVVDADEELGCVWGHRGNNNSNNNSPVVLVKCFGMAKLHPHVQTGMHLISINNEIMDDACRARDVCDTAQPGQALTFLLYQPPLSTDHHNNSSSGTGSGSPGSSAAASIRKGATISFPNNKNHNHKKKPASTEQRPLRYVTTRVYKKHQDCKTGFTLTTTGQRVVRVARVQAPACSDENVHVGMRLVSIENADWFSHHTEAVALIRSLPAGYVTFLLAAEHDPSHHPYHHHHHHRPHHAKRSNSLDNTSVATTAPGSWTNPEDDASYQLDSSSRRGGLGGGGGGSSGEAELEVNSSSTTTNSCTLETDQEKTSPEEQQQQEEEPAPELPPRLFTATLSPEQAQQVILTENEDEDVVYLHQAVAHLQAGWQVISVNGETMASAGHYEHFLQTAEQDVTLTVQAPQETFAADATVDLITATAVRPTFETKTGIVLKNGAAPGSVLVSRLTEDTLFPTLQSGMRVISINGHDWFTNYQEAIGLIRSLMGEITIVAHAVPEEEV